MLKYIVTHNNDVLYRGTCEYYMPPKDLVPYGYAMVWAWCSPEMLLVNVVPESEVEPMIVPAKRLGIVRGDD